MKIWRNNKEPKITVEEIYYYEQRNRIRDVKLETTPSSKNESKQIKKEKKWRKRKERERGKFALVIDDRIGIIEKRTEKKITQNKQDKVKKNISKI